MAITSGMTLGPYEIIAPLGAGGMGEVYRARDQRLGREVAIKLLPAEFSRDEDRLRRFEQEARATSALNHPNILTVYDIGNHEGAPYIIAELLEGEELREQLNGGALPMRRAIDYAQQIAAGLAAAHEKGIVHRDLKPENLFITKDGRVKILDFGLAKLKPQRNEPIGSEVATQRKITDPGTVMGTVGYMSPEQVRGQEADHRADIFSFGIILFEMLSGQRPFQRETMAETMTAILKEEPPDLGETNPKISPALDKIVRRCLEKKPEHRFHSAHDLGFALEALSTPSSSGANRTEAAQAPEAKHGGWRERIAWLAAAVLLLGLLASLPFAIAHLRHAPPVEAVAGRFTIDAPEKANRLNQLAISPDGRTLAFNAVVEGKAQLWVRPLDSFTARALPGTDGFGGDPFWSPDSRSLVFQAEGKLKKIDLSDGAQQTLCEFQTSARGFGGAWNHAGDILVFRSPIIYRIPAAGGTPAPVPGFDQPEQNIDRRWPSFLPDGQHFLYVVTGAQLETPELYVTSLDGKVNQRLLTTSSNAIYTTTPAGEGRLLFVRDGTLLAQPFDAGRLTLTGEPAPVVESVLTNPNRLGYFSVSDNGTLVYAPGASGEGNQLAWFDRAGKLLEPAGALGNFEFPRLSPDSKRVAARLADLKTGNGDIYVLDLARGANTRLTFDPGNERFPLWSPDGSRIVWFSSSRGGALALYQKPASGAGQDELLLKTDAVVAPFHWSADGKFIVYSRFGNPQTGTDVWVLPLGGDRQPFPFLQTPFAETFGRFSPDVRWLAYQSNESGRMEIYVQTFPAGGGKWQVSTNGGANPQWRGDGKEMFYLSGDGKMMAVEVKGGSAFEPGQPRVLFDFAAVGQITSSTSYGVTDDGQRFLFFKRPPQEIASLQYAVVVNWAAEAKPK